jgi:hypothetical protein
MRITILFNLHCLIQITLHGIQYQIVLYNNVMKAQLLTICVFYHQLLALIIAHLIILVTVHLLFYVRF